MPPNDLPRADAIVLSLEDLAGDWALAQTWAALAPVIVVTQGKAGCTVFTRLAEPRHIPARPHAEVDPTGAGDVFAAAFFINLYETGDPFDSAAFANAVAGFSVTRPGLSGVPSSDEVGLCRVKPII
jgi:sugar/nucleoside kinase (ribokinase family)